MHYTMVIWIKSVWIYVTVLLVRLTYHSAMVAGYLKYMRRDFSYIISAIIIIQVFENEPEGSWERQMVIESQGTVQQIQEIIQSLWF